MENNTCYKLEQCLPCFDLRWEQKRKEEKKKGRHTSKTKKKGKTNTTKLIFGPDQVAYILF